MSNFTTVGKIRKLITQGRTQMAAEQLVVFTKALDKDLFESALLLNSRVELLEKQINEGVLSVSDQSIEQARLTKSLLALTTDVEELNTEEINIEETTKETHLIEPIFIPKKRVENSQRILWGSAIIVGIVAFAFWLTDGKTKGSVAISDKSKLEVVEQKKSFDGYIRFSNGKPAPLSKLDINYQNTSYKADADERGYYQIELPQAAVSKTIYVTIINKGKAVTSDSILLNEANLKLRTIKVE